MAYPKGSYEHRILAHLQRNKKSSLAELFPVVRIDPTRVKDIVRELVKRDELEEFKPGHYRLGPAAPELDDAGNGDDLEAQLLGALAAKNRATRNVLASAVGQPPASLTQVLRGMSERGLIDLDGSAWVLTEKGSAKAPAAKARAEAEEVPAAPKARNRKRLAPMPSPPPAQPAALPTGRPTMPAPAAALPSPRPVVSPPSAAAVPAPTLRPSAPTPRTLTPLEKAAPVPASPAVDWDEGFAFALIPRQAKALVLDDVLDLSDLGTVATSKDGWVELRWDAEHWVLAVVPVAERSRHAVRMQGGRIATPYAGRLLGTGEVRAEWEEAARTFLLSTPCA